MTAQKFTRLLSKEEFHATFLQPSEDVTRTATNVLNVWPYAAAVPLEHLRGHVVVPEMVDRVYRRGVDRYDHVLATTTTENVFLVIVVDLREDGVFGHFLLDLNEEYGLPTPQ